MKVSTTYSFKANGSYVYYDGRLNFTDRTDPSHELALDVELSFDNLCQLAESLNSRIKRIKDDQLAKVREQLKEVDE